MSQTSITIPLDAEHGLLRLAILAAFVIVWAASFSVLGALIPALEGLNLLAALIGFGLAYLATIGLERVLKGRWRSGRVVEINPNGVHLLKRGTQETSMRVDEAVQMLCWRFEVTRRARVPKGWSMLACALEYEGTYLSVYTFMSPKQFDAYPQSEQFTKLLPRKDKKTPQAQASLRGDLAAAGEQKRLFEAEQRRWMEGGEMTADDFILFVQAVQSRFPEWHPIR